LPLRQPHHKGKKSIILIQNRKIEITEKQRKLEICKKKNQKAFKKRMKLRLKMFMSLQKGDLPIFEFEEVVEILQKSAKIKRKIKKIGKKSMVYLQNEEFRFKKSQVIRTFSADLNSLKIRPKSVKTSEITWKTIKESKNICKTSPNLKKSQNHQSKKTDIQFDKFTIAGKFKFPKPKLKFPIPNKKMLERLNVRLKEPPSIDKLLENPSKSGPSSSSSLRKTTVYKKRSVVIKDKQVHHLKIKLKKVLRIFNAFEANLVQIKIDQQRKNIRENLVEKNLNCSSSYKLENEISSKKISSHKAKSKSKSKILSKTQITDIKYLLRKYFLILSKKYSSVKSQFADSVAVCLILQAAIKAELPTKIFLTALRPVHKNKIIDVKTIRKSKGYQMVKQMIKDYREIDAFSREVVEASPKSSRVLIMAN